MKHLRYSFIVFTIISIGCADSEDTKTKDALLKLFDSSVKERNSTFQLTGLSFAWDSLLIVGPYSDVKKIKFSKKINTDILDEAGMQSRDDVCVLAFIKDDQIISYVEINRKYDFAELSADRLYSKNQVFQIMRDPFTKERYMIKRK